MEGNLDWLWYAFSAAWIIHILYLVSLSSREKKLRRELEYLKTLLKEHEDNERAQSPV